MVSTHILYRTFYIRYKKFLATAFTFESSGIQFLASTAHTFPFTENGQEIEFELMQDNNWTPQRAVIHKSQNQNADVVALKLEQDISLRSPVKLEIGGLTLSGDTYFLGFPYGKYMEDTSYLNKGYPIPYVKKGIFSTLTFRIDDVEIFYVDGINNPGFSGGPCIFIPAGQQLGHEIPTICGIVKGYLPHEIEVKTPFGNYPFIENSGLVEVHSIRNLLEIDL